MKNIFLALAIMIAIPAMTNAQTFLDVPPNHPQYKYIEDMVMKWIVDSNVNYRPDDKITRWELAKIVVLSSLWVAEDKIQNAQSFIDVDPKDWYWPYIESARYFNLLHWYPNWRYKPASYILRPEALKIILLSSGLPQNPKRPKIEYRDWVKNLWFEDQAYTAFNHWIYKWVIWKNWRPQMLYKADHQITRGEMAEYMSKTIELAEYYK